MDQNIATLLSTLIGGMLAITGGLIANYAAGKTTEGKERKALIRSKLEDLFSVIQEMEALNLDFYKNLSGMFGPKDLNKSSEYIERHKVLFNKYALIMSLYMHDMDRSSKKLLNSLTDLMSNAIRKSMGNEYSIENGAEDMKRIIEVFSDMYSDISVFSKKRGI